MKLVLLLVLCLPTVLAVDVPLILTVDGVPETVIAEQQDETPHFDEATLETPITGAVAYDESGSSKPWALWFILGVAGVIAAILVLRR